MFSDHIGVSEFKPNKPLVIFFSDCRASYEILVDSYHNLSFPIENIALSQVPIHRHINRASFLYISPLPAPPKKRMQSHRNKIIHLI